MRTRNGLFQFCLFLSILCVFILPTKAMATVEIYGDYSVSLNLDQENKEYIGNPPEGDLGAYLGGNLYLSVVNEENYQYLLDLEIIGSMDEIHGEPPLGISVNQLFLQIPLANYNYLYCGRKIKEIGVSKFFNLSNRISPRYLTGYKYERNVTPGFLELNSIVTPNRAHGFIVYFRETKNWDELNLATYIDYHQGNFSGDGYFYFEKLNDPYLGLNLSYQWGFYQFYLESIWKGKTEKTLLAGETGDLSNDFLTVERKNMLSMVAGVSISHDDWDFVLEYLRWQEGYNEAEQRQFIDYIKAYKTDVYYKPYAFSKNYLAISWSLDPFFHPDLSFEFTGVTSFQSLSKRLSSFTSWEFSTNLRYMLSQNLGITFYLQCLTGGKYGEFNNLTATGPSLALVLTHLF